MGLDWPLGSYQLHEIAFPDYQDWGSFFDQFFGTTMLGAFAVPVQHGEILISDDEVGQFLRDRALHIHSGSGSEVSCICPIEGKFAGEADGLAEEGARYVTVPHHSLLIGLGFPTGRDAVESEFGLCLGQQNHLCGSTSILPGVMVGEIELEDLFEVTQAMTAVPTEFGPSLPSNQDAVQPRTAEMVEVVAITCRRESQSIEVAMLDDRVPLKESTRCLEDLSETGLPRDSFSTDAVQVHVEAVEGLGGIDEKACAFDLALIAYGSKADLTDAVSIAVCGFDVQCHEAEIAREEVRYVDICRHRGQIVFDERVRTCRGKQGLTDGLYFATAEEVPDKSKHDKRLTAKWESASAYSRSSCAVQFDRAA